MDYGAMYAISSITTYVITVVGVIVAFAEIGITWAKVQWLIAAMTVGLGFGLQEIFANFVSGMIILFERPMRVGDVVTVGDTTGTVTNIRSRATTIVDWDRKELVVPNREFVTGRIVNWSLSDSILRLTITVGAAYGSDTDLIKKTLLEIARLNPTVLTDPEPRAVFTEFGDSTYNYELRVFVPDTESYLLVRHDLNDAIKKAFEEAHIEIAFPQRDLHVRTVEAPFPAQNGRSDNPSR
jgi:potassium efflux system protein